jgi:ribosome-associated toxin RatA of RatAB toxin-antitoxin module
MPDQSAQSILVNATPERIMSVIADFEAYPHWAGSVKSAVPTQIGADGRAAQVAFKLDAGAIRDEYELAYSWDGDRSVSWSLVRGQMQKAQEGSYTLTPRGAETEVVYSLTVDLAIPMLGMLKRKAEKVIMDTALKELKRRAENEAR